MDAYIQKLQTYFLEHEVWVAAAKSIKEGAGSQVFFSHVEGEWHLLRRDGESLLLEGPATDPDLGFCFTPASIDSIVDQEGNMGDVAVQLFNCITSEDPELKVDFRVFASFGRLLKKGYVQVLLRGGPKVLQYAASRGVHTLSDLRKLLKEAQSDDPVKALKDFSNT